MNAMVITYLTYILLSIGLTVWVAQTLYRSGRIFLVDVFRGNEAVADSVNHLLIVGFYLINLGYVSLALKISEPIGVKRQRRDDQRPLAQWVRVGILQGDDHFALDERREIGAHASRLELNAAYLHFRHVEGFFAKVRDDVIGEPSGQHARGE